MERMTKQQHSEARCVSGGGVWCPDDRQCEVEGGVAEASFLLGCYTVSAADVSNKRNVLKHSSQHHRSLDPSLYGEPAGPTTNADKHYNPDMTSLYSKCSWYIFNL